MVSRSEHDKFGFLEYYGEDRVDLQGSNFINYIKKESKKYDFLHIRSLFEVVPELRELYPNKKIIMEYSGTEIVLNKDNPIRLKTDTLVDHIMVSTPDLKEFLPNAKHIPLVIDTELFKPMPEIPKNTRALSFSMWYLEREKFQDNLKNLECEIIDRDKTFFHYWEMPSILNQYSMYVDVKYDKHRGLAKATSGTGFQALACGLPVINWKFETMNGLPSENKPENNIPLLEKIYD